MNLMKNWLKYAILGIGCFVIGGLAFNCNPDEPEVKIETITKRDTIVVTKIDSIPFTPISKEKTVVIRDTVIVEKQPDNSLDIIQTKKYSDKKLFEDSGIVLNYEIVADTLYGTKFELEYPETTIVDSTVTTITKILPPKSKLFFGGGLDVGLQGLPQNVSGGLMYNHKQKWAISAELNKDLTGILPPEKSVSVGAKVWLSF